MQHIELWKYLLLAAVGLIAGIINVMSGGGSLLTLPVLVLTGMSGPVANGTNRIAIIFQNATAIKGFKKKGYSDWKLSLTLSLCALPGVVLGAWIGSRFGGVWFNRFLAAVMVAVIILSLKHGQDSKSVDESLKVSKKRMIVAHVLMLGAGFYGGFIQAGVGFILMAILYKVLKLDLVRVNMHKVFIVGSYTIVALTIFAYRGDVWLLPGIVLAAGQSAGGWIGANLTISRGEKLIKIVWAIMVLLMAVVLIFFR